MRNAEMGLKKLKENIDTLVVIPNDKLLEITDKNHHVGSFCHG